MIAEIDQACIAVIDFVIKSAPKRTRENVHVIAGDVFFDSELMSNMNFPNTVFILD